MLAKVLFSDYMCLLRATFFPFRSLKWSETVLCTHTHTHARNHILIHKTIHIHKQILRFFFVLKTSLNSSACLFFVWVSSNFSLADCKLKFGENLNSLSFRLFAFYIFLSFLSTFFSPRILIWKQIDKKKITKSIFPLIFWSTVFHHEKKLLIK